VEIAGEGGGGEGERGSLQFLSRIIIHQCCETNTQCVWVMFILTLNSPCFNSTGCFKKSFT
jgi:hypothetical protein